MSNGGRCNVCNGEGHIARDCPSSPGQDGKATGDTCYGCSGKGHQKAVCPTANPQLKGGGKGKGGWQQDGGKGKGGSYGQKGGWQQKGGNKKEKEAEKAKEGGKEKAVVSMTWIYGEEVRTVEEIGESGTIRAITEEFGLSVV